MSDLCYPIGRFEPPAEVSPEQQWARTLIHPEEVRLDLATLAGHYAWHGRHHLAHVTTTAERLGW